MPFTAGWVKPDARTSATNFTSLSLVAVGVINAGSEELISHKNFSPAAGADFLAENDDRNFEDDASSRSTWKRDALARGAALPAALKL